MDTDGPNESLAQILKDAIKVEMLAANFYSRGADSSTNTEIVALFGSLRDDEIQHESALRELYRELLGREAPPQIIQIPEDVPLPAGDAEAILRLAMEREDRARNYYRFLAVQADALDAKELLTRLESFEEHHYELLEMELKGRRRQPWSQPELDNWVRDD